MASKKPYVAAILVQITFAGMNLMSKAAFTAGMSSYVFFFYRQAAGTLVLIPYTMFFKGKEKPPLSFKNLSKIFGIALIGMTLALEAYGVAVDYTSATFGAAASNCIPVTTFLFAVLFRMEKVNVKRPAGIAKVAGIIVCTAGVTVLTFYKGPYFKPISSHHLFHHAETESTHAHRPAAAGKTWIIGCVFLVGSCISSGSWLVLQAHFLKSFPSPLIFVCLQSVMSTVQSLIIAIVMEREPSQWKLGWNIRLFALLYCGIFIVAIANSLQCWVIKEKGPVFHAMTTPLDLVATVVGSGLLLAEGIYLGSIIGALLLVVSLYSVLWGKSKDPITTQPSSSPQKESEMSSAEVDSTIV